MTASVLMIMERLSLVSAVLPQAAKTIMSKIIMAVKVIFSFHTPPNLLIVYRPQILKASDYVVDVNCGSLLLVGMVILIFFPKSKKVFSMVKRAALFSLEQAVICDFIMYLLFLSSQMV